MSRAKNHYTDSLTIAGGDNTEKTVMASKPSGLRSLYVLVVFAAGADGTLDLVGVWQDADGENDLEVPIATGLSASQPVAFNGPAPAVLKAQRSTSTTGDVTVAVLPTVVV